MGTPEGAAVRAVPGEALDGGCLHLDACHRGKPGHHQARFHGAVGSAAARARRKRSVVVDHQALPYHADMQNRVEVTLEQLPSGRWSAWGGSAVAGGLNRAEALMRLGRLLDEYPVVPDEAIRAGQAIAAEQGLRTR